MIIYAFPLGKWYLPKQSNIWYCECSMFLWDCKMNFIFIRFHISYFVDMPIIKSLEFSSRNFYIFSVNHIFYPEENVITTGHKKLLTSIKVLKVIFIVFISMNISYLCTIFCPINFSVYLDQYKISIHETKSLIGKS